jgi:hypothetical protein
MKTHRGDYFCPDCGGLLALHFDSAEKFSPAGVPYTARVPHLFCSTQNCSLQYKRQELPEA